MNVHKLIIAFFICFSLYLLVNRVFMEGVTTTQLCNTGECAEEGKHCYYEPKCDPNGGKGCNAGGIDQKCRFCGFGEYTDINCGGPSPISCKFNGEIDVTALDLDASKHDFLLYYTNKDTKYINGKFRYIWGMSNGTIPDKEINDEYIKSILDCLYLRMNITSIRVKKETCRRLIPWDKYEYILEVKSDRGGKADFFWRNGAHDTLNYIGDGDGRKMCYHATGPITKIKGL